MTSDAALFSTMLMRVSSHLSPNILKTLPDALPGLLRPAIDSFSQIHLALTELVLHDRVAHYVAPAVYECLRRFYNPHLLLNVQPVIPSTRDAFISNPHAYAETSPPGKFPVS
jgi:hypothetical protein